MPELQLSQPTEEQMTANLFRQLVDYASNVPRMEQVVVEKVSHQQLKITWRDAEFSVHVYKSGDLWVPVH